MSKPKEQPKDADPKPPPLTTKIVPPGGKAILVVGAEVAIYVRDVLGGAIADATVSAVNSEGATVSGPTKSDLTGRALLSALGSDLSSVKVVAELTAPGWRMVDDQLVPLKGGLDVSDLEQGLNVRTIRLSRDFAPKYRFAWQNPFVRDVVFRGRTPKLRDALNHYREYLLWSVEPEEEEKQRQTLKALAVKIEAAIATAVPPTIGIDGEVFMLDVVPPPPTGKDREDLIKLRKWALKLETATNAHRLHTALVRRLLDMFDSAPTTFVPWVRYMILHFSGMMYENAHFTYARPSALVCELRRHEYEQTLQLGNTWSESSFLEKRPPCPSWQLDELRHEAWRIVKASPTDYRKNLSADLAKANGDFAIRSALHKFCVDDLKRRTIVVDRQPSSAKLPAQSAVLALLDFRTRLWPSPARKAVVSFTPLRLATSDPEWFLDTRSKSAKDPAAAKSESPKTWIHFLYKKVPDAYRPIVQKWTGGQLPDWTKVYVGVESPGALGKVIKSATPWRYDMMRDPEPVIITAVCDQIGSASAYARGLVANGFEIGGLYKNAERYGAMPGNTTWEQGSKFAPVIDAVGGSVFYWVFNDVATRNQNDWRIVTQKTMTPGNPKQKLFKWFRDNKPGHYGEADSLVAKGERMLGLLRPITTRGGNSWELKSVLDWEHQAVILHPHTDGSCLTFQTSLPAEANGSDESGTGIKPVGGLKGGRAYVGYASSEAEDANRVAHLVAREIVLGPLLESA